MWLPGPLVPTTAGVQVAEQHPDFLSKPIHTQFFHAAATDAELPEQEKAFIQFHVTMPEGPSLRVLLQDPEERRKLGKCIHGGKALSSCDETSMHEQ